MELFYFFYLAPEVETDFSSMCSFSTTQWVAFCFCFVCSYFSYSGIFFMFTSFSEYEEGSCCLCSYQHS